MQQVHALIKCPHQVHALIKVAEEHKNNEVLPTKAAENKTGAVLKAVPYSMMEIIASSPSGSPSAPQLSAFSSMAAISLDFVPEGVNVDVDVDKGSNSKGAPLGAGPAMSTTMPQLR